MTTMKEHGDADAISRQFFEKLFSEILSAARSVGPQQ